MFPIKSGLKQGDALSPLLFNFALEYDDGLKLHRMKWMGHVARMVERRGVYKVLVGKPEGRNHLEDLGVDGRILLRWIFRKWDVRAWTGSMWLGIETGSGLL
jgi:hypothetical protein